MKHMREKLWWACQDVWWQVMDTATSVGSRFRYMSTAAAVLTGAAIMFVVAVLGFIVVSAQSSAPSAAPTAEATSVPVPGPSQTVFRSPDPADASRACAVALEETTEIVSASKTYAKASDSQRTRVAELATIIGVNCSPDQALTGQQRIEAWNAS